MYISSPNRQCGVVVKPSKYELQTINSCYYTFRLKQSFSIWQFQMYEDCNSHNSLQSNPYLQSSKLGLTNFGFQCNSARIVCFVKLVICVSVITLMKQNKPKHSINFPTIHSISFIFMMR